MKDKKETTPSVERIKILELAFVGECEKIRDAEGSSASKKREASIAITHIETAALWAAKAAES